MAPGTKETSRREVGFGNQNSYQDGSRTWESKRQWGSSKKVKTGAIMRWAHDLAIFSSSKNMKTEAIMR
jgi:hypothetical protein